MKKLEQLLLSNNKLSSLPLEIGELENLIILNVNNNQIETLPVSIGNLINVKIFLHEKFHNCVC